MDTNEIVVLITAPSGGIAEKIACKLLNEELAACANIIPSITSIYKWKGEVHNEQEVLMILKTRSELFDDAFIKTVKHLHPYEVPEIVALPILGGSPDYLAWIADVTKRV